MIKAIILAAGLGITKNSSIPKCLLKVGENTVLERQLQILKWAGIDEDQIIVVIGSEGICWNSKTIGYIKKLVKNVISNDKNLTTGSCYSLYLALDSLVLEDNDHILVIDGDIIFDRDFVLKLLNYPYENVLISRMSYAATSNGGRIITKNSKVIMAGMNIDNVTLPYYIYSGAAKIGGRLITVLKNELIKNSRKHVIDAIGKLVNRFKVYNLDVENINHEECPTFLVGGSGAKIRRLMIVRKEVSREGVAKLSNEIKWLLNLPKDLRRYFPKLVGYKVTKSSAYMDTVFYNFPSLRRILFDGTIGADKAIEILRKLLDFMFNNLYSRIYGKGGLGWLYKLHFERICNRWPLVMRKAPILAKVLEAKKIVLNDEEFVNAPLLIQRIRVRPELLRKLAPKIITMVHGDLHFQNILIKLNDNSKYNFLLTDPRGDLNGSDPIYDLAKLWHSFHGLYDFMHEDLFSLKLEFKNNETINADLELIDMKSVHEYNRILNHFPRLMDDFNSVSEIYDNWKMRTLFTEAIHFCTVLPFHLKGDGKEARAVALYLTGVKILNEFYRDYKVEDYEEHLEWININTEEDYLNARPVILKD